MIRIKRTPYGMTVERSERRYTRRYLRGYTFLPRVKETLLRLSTAFDGPLNLDCLESLHRQPVSMRFQSRSFGKSIILF